MIVMDPGYSEDTAEIPGLGHIIPSCATGEWRVEVFQQTPPSWLKPAPRFVLAFRSNFSRPSPEASDWQNIAAEIGGDSPLIGIYDLAHFDDASVVPKNQKWTFDGKPAIEEKLWYSLNCEAIQNRLASTIPFGVVVHWGGGMDVSVCSARNEVAAIRLSITGWPDKI